jgi:hypothetical protein
MHSQLSYAWLLTRRLLLIMGMYTLYRLLFVAFNYDSFSGNSPRNRSPHLLEDFGWIWSLSFM